MKAWLSLTLSNQTQIELYEIKEGTGAPKGASVLVGYRNWEVL